MNGKGLLQLMSAFLVVCVAHVAHAQRLQGLDLPHLAVTADPYTIGRHGMRLDFARRECGGNVVFALVDPLLKDVMEKQDRAFSKWYWDGTSRGFTDEGTRLGRLHGTPEVCGRLYELYGPDGLSMPRAYDPTGMGEPKPWFNALGSKATPRDRQPQSQAQPSGGRPPTQK